MLQKNKLELKVLHIANIIFKRVNGPRYSVPKLVENQNKLNGVQALLLNINNDKINMKLGERETKEYKFIFKYLKDYKKEIAEINPSIVIFHGVYYLKYIQIAKHLEKIRIPYIVVPRSSLTMEAQQSKKIKKAIFNYICFNKFLNKAKKIHFLTNEEREKSIKNDKSFIAGNGAEYKGTKKIKKKINEFVYVGRIAIQHKGLDLLIDVIKELKDVLKEKKIKFKLYGSDFEEGKFFLDSMIKKYELSKIVQIYPAIYGKEKEKILENADVFIMTSRFEGQPMALLEALSFGLPVAITPGTNMKDEVERYNIGWSCEGNRNDIKKMIINILDEKSVVIEKKSKNAYKIIENIYSWEKVSLKTVLEYKKILKNQKEKK